MTGPAGVRLRELRARGGFFEIGARALVFVSGPDASRYLNGQLTIDVTRLEPMMARSACLLTPKGKVCVPVDVWTREGGFVLESAAVLGGTMVSRLDRYLVSDDVRIVDESTPAAGFHVFGILPEGRNLRIDRLGCPGVDVADEPAGRLRATAEEIEVLRICAGVPLWGAEIDEETLVQEARIEERSVDFDKGCYVGQEVVSRLVSVGRVNRRLHGFRGRIESGYSAPLALSVPAQPDARPGELTSVAHDFELACTVALGYLHRNFESVGRFAVSDSSGRVLGEVEKCELPIR
jgi:folate-binding protein YgfZ